MIRLIASDIDGTLLPYGETDMDPALFPLIHRLRAAGILFCPASGRQYHSLRGLFAPVADEVCFLCENGAAVYGPGTEENAPLLAELPMPRGSALALAEDIMALPGCQALVSTETVCYGCGCGEALMRSMEDGCGYRMAWAAKPADVPGKILKVTAACAEGGVAAAQKALGPKWAETFHMAEAGPKWLDFSLADKGVGLGGLCRALDIPPADTAAFGDNWNDVAMLEAAGRPYLMDAAAPALLERFPRRCKSVREELERILEELQ